MLVARSVANGQPLDTLLEASCSAACSCHCQPTRSKQYSTKLWQFYTTIDNSSMTRFQMISMICHFPYFSYIFIYFPYFPYFHNFHIFHTNVGVPNSKATCAIQLWDQSLDSAGTIANCFRSSWAQQGFVSKVLYPKIAMFGGFLTWGYLQIIHFRLEFSMK